jgi:uncharacterized radical SAM superfamily Fe-S cluster-containing enzyme
MIHTLSLCPVCYKRIPSKIHFADGMAIMTKECDVHGPFTAVVEKDIQHVSNFYHRGTLGNNNTVIVNIHDQCNMACPWCYYPMGQSKPRPFSHYNSLLSHHYIGFNLLFSGGEPTLRPDFFDFHHEAFIHGREPSSITNMLKLGDDEFFARCMNEEHVTGNTLRFALSMQHPKNYGEAELAAKVRAIENIERHGLKAMCVMFSIQSLDELDWIRDFYDKTKHTYGMLRIRTMFGNWKNKGAEKLFLSDLHKAFLAKFSDLSPTQSEVVERSNIYCLYLAMKDGMQVSLSSAPTVENVDLHSCSRPVFMLAEDEKCYPVPVAMMVNEGLEKGWKDGYKLSGGATCG